MTWAALRYRPAQALLLAVLTALVVGCAAFAPLYERALAQSLLRDGLSRMPPAATAIELTTSREQGARVRAERVRDIFPTSLAGVYGPGVERWSGRVFVTGSQGVSTVTMWGSPTPCEGWCSTRDVARRRRSRCWPRPQRRACRGGPPER